MAASSEADSGQSLRGFDIAMIIIPTVAVALRFWSRVLSGHASKDRVFWWDDWTALMALPFSIAACSLHIYAISLGLGKHAAKLPHQNIEQMLKVLWASYFMGDAGISLPKASVLFMYSRVFTTRNRAFRYGFWLGQTLNFLAWIAAITRCLLFCTPVDKYWKTNGPGFCRSADSLYIGSAVPNVAIDLYILILPLPILLGLSLKRARKFLIVGVFLCGYLVIAISLGRLVTSLTYGKRLDEDFTYNGIPLIFWVAAEPPVSIFGCCLPPIFYLVRRCVRDGPASLFRATATSQPQFPRASQRSLSNYRLQPSDHSLEPIRGSFSTSGKADLYKGPENRYDASATKASSNSDDINMVGDIEAPAIVVRKEVHVHSEAQV
ncbi:MAG: hypothetical protein FRX48_06363 [Lasallia pustulata]|uniref:Rhodopsin domain-containing protein n=1 Tax=Lasallia pustulata TaxID=136370 RepID=A0A5M8PK36_9LECA|nr:MAG: hypothetical protein FRX48_06363 [Lasallia pustulata]